MEITTTYMDKTDRITDLYTRVFTDSEGPDEGALVGGLVAGMLAQLAPPDIRVVAGFEGQDILACIIFTRMTYAQDGRTVFILSPVAVATERQGLGHSLIRHGLDHLRQDGIDVALTYGDIAFYSRTGFRQVTEAQAPTPFPLQYPEGWLGQPSQGDGLLPLTGPGQCVGPLNDPGYW